MSQFIKHIGKHNNKKIAIIFRSIAGEDHMALVAYTETLPKLYHDAIIGVIESPVGQDAAELADVLFRNKLADGRNILQAMHKEGMIKKVPTKQVIVTPNLTSHIRLDELNEIVDGMEAGGEAAKKMKELDENSGMVEPYTRAAKADAADVADLASADTGLDDVDIAANLDAQADKLALEAKSMIAESKRLKAEAKSMKPKKKATAKKKTAKKAAKKATAKKKAIS